MFRRYHLIICMLICNSLVSCVFHTNTKLREMSEKYEAYVIPVEREHEVYKKNGKLYAVARRAKLRRNNDLLEQDSTDQYNVMEWGDGPFFHEIKAQEYLSYSEPMKGSGLVHISGGGAGRAHMESAKTLGGSWMKDDELAARLRPLNKQIVNKKRSRYRDSEVFLIKKDVDSSSILTYPLSALAFILIDTPVSLVYYTVGWPIAGIYYLFNPSALK